MSSKLSYTAGASGEVDGEGSKGELTNGVKCMSLLIVISPSLAE